MRTDIHRPAVIRPEEYQFVGFECIPQDGDLLGWAEAQATERAVIQRHMEQTGGTYSAHAHGGNCMVCGNANAIYTALFHHALTNVYVRVGRDCCEKLDAGVDFNPFHDGVRDYLNARAGKRKAEAWLASVGLSRAWQVAQADYSDVAGVVAFEESTVRDIVYKLVTYGSISERQEAFLRKLLEQIDTRAEREATRAAEREAATPAPTGRLDVSGEVLSVKAQETDFGVTIKMTVKTDAGWILWTTQPAASSAKRGDRVTLRVTVTPSADDPKFAFGKRPTLLGEAVCA